MLKNALSCFLSRILIKNKENFVFPGLLLIWDVRMLTVQFSKVLVTGLFPNLIFLVVFKKSAGNKTFPVLVFFYKLRNFVKQNGFNCFQICMCENQCRKIQTQKINLVDRKINQKYQHPIFKTLQICLVTIIKKIGENYERL